LHWWRRLRRITSDVRRVAPITSGREYDALQRVRRDMGITPEIKLVISGTTMEPGILGVLRPFLLLPNGIADRLTDAQLDVIIRHELCHVRRHDNLVASLHMLVEAIFWFHPLVWWIGSRLVHEREHACDEEVLKLGSDPHVYAEGILKVCKFYVESPLPCAAGVTGSNLKKRIEAIMNNRSALKLDFSRKLLLSTAGIATLAVPLMLGLLSAPQTHAGSRARSAVESAFVYQSVSIKLDKAATEVAKSGKDPISVRMLSNSSGFTVTGTSLRGLILAAYELQEDRVSGGPDWINSELYEVEAKIDPSTASQLQKLPHDQENYARRRMLQALLADHFKLQVHRESKELPVYALLMSDGGPNMQEATPGNTYANGPKGLDGKPVGPGMMVGGMASSPGGPSTLTAQAVPMSSFVQHLSWQTGRTVLDMTGLRGNYDFTLQWKPEIHEPGDGHAAHFDAAIFGAIQQLGLKLEPQKALMEVLVIDHVEKPSEN
jgi:bla regulator protein blaR1